ncbi:MAG: membrane protein insertion efficiency factor YidD [Candidatus Jacksonbacteria bacterium RIFOXYC2_FULL_44_29]|nr:MAG: hypothetical protein UW45_C0013G0007 [Parcubacteria group bacterium GW2011_GWC2_44_22]OGY74957.1 MAG: membrane protein insertion efficiency factor YidD [Candidatus Jacksonbacteria bacterium RIFOXYA2_FULL_43_12]OGY76510.1 MAG: membrane protein insertion efficiency factor YidD [Candidatus Jacksonbacteria bacterium RIFOXYB2_FULL_44_15]OGY78490.1 MAG: membrane protein insertion efficiency factor YidD [Candidatus Jacksonbacteria bacterium RIFOXYC2_FULL_44_29]OGY81147.1 MAG: membrane protein 
MTWLILKLIRLYQKTISLDHGPLKFLRPNGQCKFYPSCSNYSCLAIKKYGIARGCYLALKRLGRCHPWSIGGVDEV